ncbi:general secretion pathway protein GspK [Thiovibrio sp. JS02]
MTREERRPAAGITRNSQGFALLVVIVVLLLTSFLASQLILAVRTEQRITFNARVRNQAAMLSEAGVNIALFRLMDKPLALEAEEEYGALRAGEEYEAFLEQGRVSYHAANESGKIDLNTAPSGLVELFLQYHGLSPDESAIVMDSLLDWRDTDTLHRVNGAEQDYYQTLPGPYIPRNGRIEDPAEFFLIRGTARLAGRFDPLEVFTVSNTEKKINLNSLTPAMLDFVVAGDVDRRKAYFDAKEVYATLNPAMAMQIIGEERFRELEPFLGYSEGAASRIFSITATGQPGVTPDTEDPQAAMGVTVQAVVRLLANGYQILAWKERYS